MPHSILTEGSEDKNVLKKTFALKDHKFGITNGCGSNVVQVASKFNEMGVEMFVLLDDDEAGQNYKEKILNIGGSYNHSNVFTLHDLVPEVVSKATIEDFLGANYVGSKFIEFSECDKSFKLVDSAPYLTQIKIYISMHNLIVDLDAFKKMLSDNFSPSKSGFDKKFPLLELLTTRIIKKINSH